MAQHTQIHGGFFGRFSVPTTTNVTIPANARTAHCRNKFRRTEPVVLLAFFEHRLEARQAEREQPDAGPVHVAGMRSSLSGSSAGKKRRARQHGEDAEGDVDEEDPAPAHVIRQPSAQHRPPAPARRSRPSPKIALRRAAFVRCKRLEHHRLRLGEQPAARQPLQHPRGDEESEVG